jgi:hypothetical protein
MLRNTTCTELDSIVVDVEGSAHRDATSLTFLLRLSAYVSESQCSHIELVDAMSDLQHTLAEASPHGGFRQT